MIEPLNEHPQTWLKTVLSKFFSLFLTILAWFRTLFYIVWYMIRYFLHKMHNMEQLFLKMDCIYSFLCQLLFIMMCEMAFLGVPSKQNDQYGVTSISALLLYCVVGHFTNKVRDIFENDWIHITRNEYSATLFFKWFILIVSEWTKTFSIIFYFKDRGISFVPKLSYTLTTFSYYVSTEKGFIELLIMLAGYFNVTHFDGMEHLYVPIILHIYTILSAGLVSSYLVYGPCARYAVFASYFTLYLKFKDLYYNFLKKLYIEKETYSSFRIATDNDIKKWDDICAVCLSPMNFARVTPCNHLFHPACLKQCLRSSLQCPLCKYNFRQ